MTHCWARWWCGARTGPPRWRGPVGHCGELEVDGIETNRSFLAALLDQEWFARGEFHTGTLETWLGEFTAQNGAR